MKSSFVICVIKIIAALAHNTNDELSEGHKIHDHEFKDDSIILNSRNGGQIPDMVQAPLKHQDYKIERREIINEHNLPFNHLEVRYDPAKETGAVQTRKKSNSNSGININNNVSDNLEGVEINNIQQENKRSDSKLKANFIDLISSNLRNNSPNQKSYNDDQEYIENEESSNDNTDVNIHNNVNNNKQKVQINNIQQKNELNRRRMNINSRLNGKLLKNNVGNSYLETNEERQSSVINSLPFNGHTRRNMNSNFNSDVNIHNDVYHNYDKIDLDNIEQKNEQNWRRMQSALNAQISQNKKNIQLQPNSVSQISLYGHPSQGFIMRKLNSNANSGMNINNDVYGNSGKVQLDNIQQKNEENRRRIHLTHNAGIYKENEREVDLLSLISPKKKLQSKTNMNINTKVNIGNKLHHDVQKVVISNINQKNIENIKKMSVQSILSYFSYFIHHPPKDKDLNALKRKKETYMTMLNYFIKYLGEMGVPDSEIIYYIQLAKSYESDAEIREEYNKLIHLYQNSSQNPDTDDISKESPVTIIPELLEEVNLDELRPGEKGNIKEKNIQLILSNFNDFLHNSPKDEDESVLKEKKKIYLLELIDYIKYLEVNGVSDLAILSYLEEAEKYESDDELKKKYNELIHSYQNSSQNPDTDEIIAEGPITIIPDILEEINLNQSHPEENGNIRDKNIQLIVSNFNDFLHNAPKDEDESALKEKRKIYLLELVDHIKYLEANGVPDLKILLYLEEAAKYESDEELRKKYNELIHSYQNQSENPGIDDTIIVTPVTIIPDHPEEVNLDESNPEKEENIQLILSKFYHFLHNSPKDEDLIELKQNKEAYLLKLIDFIKYMEAIGVPDLKILWSLQEAQKYESDEELRTIYGETIDAYKKTIPNGQQSHNIEMLLKKIIMLRSENDEDINSNPAKEIYVVNNPVADVSDSGTSKNKDENIENVQNYPSNEANKGTINIQLIQNKPSLIDNFKYFLHHAPKDNNIGELKKNRLHYVLELIQFIKNLKASGISKLKIIQCLEEALTYETDPALKVIYWTLIHIYKKQIGDVNKEPSSPSDDILPNPITEIEEESQLVPGIKKCHNTVDDENDGIEPCYEEITPQWKPEDAPPHSEPEITPPSHVEAENNPPHTPENEPDKVNPPNILDILKPPYNLHHINYIDDLVTHLIQHLKYNGFPDEEIQKIVQISLINVIKSMAQYSLSQCQEKIVSEIRHQLQLNLYRYKLHKCCKIG